MELIFLNFLPRNLQRRHGVLPVIDFAVPGDSRIEEKKKDKIEKYQELGRELWNICRRYGMLK